MKWSEIGDTLAGERWGMMELYKWYKGTELPTKECACVVVYNYPMTRHNKVYTRIETLGQWIRSCQEYVFINQDDNVIPNDWVLAWMPIKFPEEVEK